MTDRGPCGTGPFDIRGKRPADFHHYAKGDAFQHRLRRPPEECTYIDADVVFVTLRGWGGD